MGLRDILAATCRINSAHYLDNHRLHEMVACAMEESWDVVRGHIERYDAILRSVVADGISRFWAEVLADDWTAVTRDKSLSAQFEHSIGVTSDGCEIFTLSPAGLHTPHNPGLGA